MKLGAIVTLYNREKFIGPYLEHIMSYGITPIVTLSSVPWNDGWGGNDEVVEHDKSEAILEKFFPEVQVIRGEFVSHQQSFAAAFPHIGEFERVIIDDCDMFMTKDVMVEFLKNLEYRYGSWTVAHGQMIIEYYYDWRYGLLAGPMGPPPIMAYDPRCGRVPTSMTTMTGPTDTFYWNDDVMKIHHFRFSKDNGSGKTRCIEPETTDGYIQAPEEIVTLLKKWDQKIQKL